MVDLKMAEHFITPSGPKDKMTLSQFQFSASVWCQCETLLFYDNCIDATMIYVSYCAYILVKLVSKNIPGRLYFLTAVITDYITAGIKGVH